MVVIRSLYKHIELLNRKGSTWLDEFDVILQGHIKFYKRAVVIQKRRVVTKLKQGEIPYNMSRYEAICLTLIR